MATMRAAFDYRAGLLSFVSVELHWIVSPHIFLFTSIMFVFLAVQDSSIGDLVTQSLSHVLISDYSDTTVTLQ